LVREENKLENAEQSLSHTEYREDNRKLYMIVILNHRRQFLLVKRNYIHTKGKYNHNSRKPAILKLLMTNSFQFWYVTPTHGKKTHCVNSLATIWAVHFKELLPHTQAKLSFRDCLFAD